DDLLGPTFTSVSYTTVFGDTLSVIAAKLGALLPAADYDVIVLGRVLTISNATTDQHKDISAQVVVGPNTTGRAVVVPQLRFTSSNWSMPQTVRVMAIDDLVLDGGDAQVFAAFEDRVNAVRGPLTIVGGPLAGEERFLNNPFRLPEETNDPQADGTVNTVTFDTEGHAVMFDHESFHFNAIYGERPGFDPRMNSFPFEF